ncbi:MAG TPA: hypothetical protein DCZ55_00355 [Cyanobacteria bacterium UBA11371]|nr:hypothetical protein [Cyanobacteria bacterium UBA11371]
MLNKVSMSICRVTVPFTVAGASIAFSFTSVQAATLKYNLNFETTGQSIWAPGSGVSFTDDRFLGVSWNEGLQKTIVPQKTLIPSVTLVPETATPYIPRKLLTPEIPPKLIPGTGIPRKLLTPEIPPKLIPGTGIPPQKIPGTDPVYVESGIWKTCVNPIGCGGPYYTPAIPAKYTPRIPAVYSPAIPAKYTPRIPAVYSPAIPSVKIPAVKSPEFKSPSVGVAASTKAKAGLQSKLKIEGGTVNSFIPINLFLEIPDGKVKPGETITIKSGFSVADGATFSTASPIASYILDLVFGLKANSGFQVGANKVPIFDFNVPEKRTNFLNLNPQNASFGVPLGDVGSLKVKVPTVNTTGFLDGANKLTSKGSDSFVQGKLDLDALVTKLFPAIPPLQGSFEASVIPKPNISVPGFSTDDILKKLGIGNLDLSARANYNLLDMTLGANLNLGQSFSLLAEGLTGKLIPKNGSPIPFKVGQDVTIKVPDFGGADGIFNIDAVVDLNAIFSNKTSLGFDVNFAVLAGLLEIDPPFNVPGLKFGPLFDKNLQLLKGDLASLYNKSFNLTGFSSRNFSLGIPVASVAGGIGTLPGGTGTLPGGTGTLPGGTGTLPGGIGTLPGGTGTLPGGSATVATSVPEPNSSAALLGISVISFSFIRRRRQAQTGGLAEAQTATKV